MNRIAVIYWSGTGNTQMMAEAVAQGTKDAGGEVTLLSVSDTDAAAASSYDALALGCPAMGGEMLEESEFEPFFSELEGKLSGKKVALFGSYDWGDGQWMRDWQQRTEAAGAKLVAAEGLIVHLTPEAADLEQCAALGKSLAE